MSDTKLIPLETELCLEFMKLVNNILKPEPVLQPEPRKPVEGFVSFSDYGVAIFYESYCDAQHSAGNIRVVKVREVIE